MRLFLLAIASCAVLLGCTPTRVSTTSSFNDGHDTWRHTDTDTEKTRTVEAEAERTTLFDKATAAGAKAGVGWITKPLDAQVPLSSFALKQMASFIVSELMNAPPPIEILGPWPAGAAYDFVYGLVFRFEFPHQLAWMEDHRQSPDDANGRRDLTFRVRALGSVRTIRLTQDSNVAYGWCECEPFPWARGTNVQIAVYDADAFFDDGMISVMVPDVQFYYDTIVKDDDESMYRVGRIGFLSQSDVELMRKDYAHLKVGN